MSSNCTSCHNLDQSKQVPASLVNASLRGDIRGIALPLLLDG
jgi:hypothetical protein